MKKYFPCLIYIFLSLLLSCAPRSAKNLKIAFIYDSSDTSKLKAAKQAVERFNAETDIKGLSVSLEILEWQKLSAKYIQDNKDSLIGFVMEDNSRITQLPKTLDDLLFISLKTGETRQNLHLNIQRSALEKNLYLAKFIQEYRPLDYLYVIYTKEHRGQAQDFTSIMQEKGQKLEFLEYNLNPSSGQINSIADFFRDERQQIQSRGNSGIVFFFNRERANIINSYLKRSPYRYLFKDLDFYLASGKNLQDPDVPNYYVFQTSDVASPNYLLFREQYQKKYRLKADYFDAELFDAVCLIAHTTKKILDPIQNLEKSIGPILYQKISQTTYAGITGPISFDKNGNRVSDHVVVQLLDEETKPIAYYSANEGRFLFE